jgi:hypothetical protein
MQFFFRLISYLFYPGTMAMLGVSMVSSGETVTVDLWLLIIAGFIVLPLLLLFAMFKAGKIDSIHIPIRSQRNLMYGISVGLAGLTTWLLFWQMGQMVFIWSLCMTIVLAGVGFCNALGLKASAHMAGSGGLLAWSFALAKPGYLPGWIWISTVCICCLVYLARKGLSAHSHLELLVGFCLGFILTFAMAT